MSLSTPYAAQIRTVELLERARAQSTEIRFFRDGSQIIPTAATYTLKKPTGADLLTAQTALIAGNGTVSYAHTAEQLAASELLGEGYVQEWTVTISGEDYIFRRMASLVLKRLYPVVSDVDLTATYSDLENLRPSSMSSYQQYIDDAWYQILRRIRNRGMGYEYLIMSPETFFEAHRHLSLYLIFRDFHSSLGQSNGRFLDLSTEHYRLYRDEFDQINFVYDESHDGRAEDADKRTRGQPTIYLTRPGVNQYRRRRY